MQGPGSCAALQRTCISASMPNCSRTRAWMPPTNVPDSSTVWDLHSAALSDAYSTVRHWTKGWSQQLRLAL